MFGGNYWPAQRKGGQLMRHLVTIIVCFCMLTGCAPSYDFSLPDVKPANHKLNAEIKEISMFYGTTKFNDPSLYIKADRMMNKGESEYSRSVVTAWGMALHDAVKQLALFDKSGAKKVTLSLNIQEVHIPLVGASFTSRVLANYQIIDRGTDKILYNKTIESEGTVPWNYAYLARTRALESLTRAVQNNISSFVTHLKALKHL